MQRKRTLFCAYCHALFTTRRTHQRFCSQRCNGGARQSQRALWFQHCLDAGADPHDCWVAPFSRAIARWVWQVVYGPIPRGLYVCHRCDVPTCGNPLCLWLGTSADNTADRHAKGRDAAGECHGSRTKPERLARGTRNGRYTKPECTARGIQNGAYTKPEKRPRGERHGCAKLTETDVRALRTVYGAAPSEAEAVRLADVYGISKRHVFKIVARRMWKHVA